MCLPLPRPRRGCNLRGRRLPAGSGPGRAVPIHQGIIAPDARGIYYDRLTEMTSTDFQVLPEESATVTF